MMLMLMMEIGCTVLISRCSLKTKMNETKTKMVCARKSRSQFSFSFFLSSLFSALFFLHFRQNEGRYFVVTSNERSSVHWCQWSFRCKQKQRTDELIDQIDWIVICEASWFVFTCIFGINLMLNTSTKVQPNNRPTFGRLKVLKGPKSTSGGLQSSFFGKSFLFESSWTHCTRFW